MSLSRSFGLLLLSTLCSSASWASGVDIWFESPLAGIPLSGRVEVEIKADSPQEIAHIDLQIDGRSLERRRVPPFRWTLDLGDSTEGHQLIAEATSLSGGKSRAQLVIPALRIDEEIKVSLTQLFVSVSDGSALVGDLTREQFRVFEDERPRPLVTFERGDIPLTALLLLDCSESMKGKKMRTALAGARTFVEHMQPLDRAALLLFADRTVRSTEFTGFPQLLLAALGTVEPTGGTSLVDHIFVGLSELENRIGRKVLIVLSDGLDSSSVLEMRDLLVVSDRSAALIYWLRLPLPGGRRARFSTVWRDSEGYRTELELLHRLVERSGGRIFDLETLEDIEIAFRDVLAELRDQYVLGFFPDDQREAQELRVEVLGRQHLELRYRQRD